MLAVDLFLVSDNAGGSKAHKNNAVIVAQVRYEFFLLCFFFVDGIPVCE